MKITRKRKSPAMYNNDLSRYLLPSRRLCKACHSSFATECTTRWGKKVKGEHSKVRYKVWPEIGCSLKVFHTCRNVATRYVDGITLIIVLSVHQDESGPYKTYQLACLHDAKLQMRICSRLASSYSNQHISVSGLCLVRSKLGQHCICLHDMPFCHPHH